MSAPPVEFEREQPSLAVYDWVQTSTGDKLHAVWMGSIRIEETLARLDEAEPALAHTACGRYSTLSIPGPLTRMGAMRCRQCCTVTGLPQGKGSPKNDAAIRRLLGWDRE